ncbi:hypothetical protein BDN71DRAFT_1427492 [Pleurotus eryngii]|uniref:Uncharacterized protein n=1 Tax=Pleurotus eryngii TaxID=5323 RepID=A0A9P6A6X9_PLEER|nr:hypothetical protein BDN71DRAFT_1427492 [Pleurotus eryngii]
MTDQPPIDPADYIFIVEGNEQFMGIWVSDEACEDVSLYLAREEVACFFLYEYHKGEESYHHWTHLTLPSDLMQNYSLIFARDAPWRLTERCLNLHTLALGDRENYGAALTILKGINNVWLRYYKAEGGPIDLVPISERHALVLVVPHKLIAVSGRRRRLAASPALKMNPSVEGEGGPSNWTLLTSDGIGNLETGPWKGFKGVVEEAIVTELALSVWMKGRYCWEDIEVPKEDLAHAGQQGSTTTVKAGPYTRLTGKICKYLHHMAVISPDTDIEQTIDVRIISGTLKGRSGFYVGVDEAKAQIYFDELANAADKEAPWTISKTVSIPFACIQTPPDTRIAQIVAQGSQSKPTPFRLPPNTWNPQNSQAMYMGDPFQGLEVVIVDHTLKGYEGYIVGSHFINR